MLTPAPRLVDSPENVTAPVAAPYDAVAPTGKPLNATPESPGVRPRTNVVPAAIDGPVLLYVTVPLTVLPATAVGGIEMTVFTSASGDIAVVPVALSESVFGPWLVVVLTLELTVTDPDAGAV